MYEEHGRPEGGVSGVYTHTQRAQKTAHSSGIVMKYERTHAGALGSFAVPWIIVDKDALLRPDIETVIGADVNFRLRLYQPDRSTDKSIVEVAGDRKSVV